MRESPVSREPLYLQKILVGSLSCSILLSIILTLMRTKWVLVLIALVLLTILSRPIVSSFRKRNSSPYIFISLAIFNLLIIVPELALRIFDFQYVSGIQLQNSQLFINYEPDEKLFWKLKPSDPSANSFGFPGNEVVVPKPEGTFRILFLGDSVMQQGYPEIVQNLLNYQYADSGLKFESVTLALAGYTSYQGLVLAEMYGEKFEPDLVVIGYGWNDHWKAYEAPDAEKTITSAAGNEIFNLFYEKFRILQALNWASASLSGEREPIDQVRVPADDYRVNLDRIIDLVSKENVPIILITAPTSFYRLGVPSGIVEQKFADSQETIIQLHQEYNQIVRAVAQDREVYLLDLEQEFDRVENLRSLFSNDGIHFTSNGLSVLGYRVAEFIGANLLSGK